MDMIWQLATQNREATEYLDKLWDLVEEYIDITALNDSDKIFAKKIVKTAFENQIILESTFKFTDDPKYPNYVKRAYDTVRCRFARKDIFANVQEFYDVVATVYVY